MLYSKQTSSIVLTIRRILTMNAKPEIRIPIPRVGFTPPVYYCKRATMPHTLDGRLDKDFWKDAPFTEYFQDIEGPTLPEPRFRTRAKMLWDDENLYIGAILEDRTWLCHLPRQWFWDISGYQFRHPGIYRIWNECQKHHLGLTFNQGVSRPG